MKTIHTDSPYTGFAAAPEVVASVVLEARKDDRSMLESKVELEELDNQYMKADRSMLESEAELEKIDSQDRKVKECSLHVWWNLLQDKLAGEHADTSVKYGLGTMVLLLAVSTWLSA